MDNLARLFFKSFKSFYFLEIEEIKKNLNMFKFSGYNHVHGELLRNGRKNDAEVMLMILRGLELVEAKQQILLNYMYIKYD